MPSRDGRSIYRLRGVQIWNGAIFAILVVGGLQNLVSGLLDARWGEVAFGVAWLALAGIVGWSLFVRTLYRIELDAHQVYWRHLRAERSADVADVKRVSSAANVATVEFRSGRAPLKVFTGAGFERLVGDLKAVQPDVVVDLGWGPRVSARLPFGGRYDAAG